MCPICYGTYYSIGGLFFKNRRNSGRDENREENTHIYTQEEGWGENISQGGYWDRLNLNFGNKCHLTGWSQVYLSTVQFSSVVRLWLPQPGTQGEWKASVWNLGRWSREQTTTHQMLETTFFSVTHFTIAPSLVRIGHIALSEWTDGSSRVYTSMWESRDGYTVLSFTKS